jgi:tetratricopeptide (TPR) repeat protein
MDSKKNIPSKASQKGKNRDITPSKNRKKGDGTLSLHIFTYTIVYEPMEDEYTKLVPPEIEDEMNNELYDLIKGNPREAIDRLNQLKQEYPNYPRIYNYLSFAYSLLGDSKNLSEIVEENYRENPEYFFAKINYAETCLHRGEVGKIPAIFDNKFDLKLLYPHRNEFHITEAVSFFALLGDYYLMIGNLEQARRMLTTLKRIDPDGETTKVLGSKLRIR